MNKTQLIETVADKTGLAKKDAKNVVETVFETIAETLSKGEDVNIHGFANFVIATRAERIGINPSTKEKITIPASKYVKLKVAKPLKEAINS